MHFLISCGRYRFEKKNFFSCFEKKKFFFQTHLGIKGMIENEDGEPIFNATIKVYQLINNNWDYIDHDVISSKLY